MIMAGLFRRFLVCEVLEIGKPEQLGNRDIQPFGQGAGALDGGNVPLFRSGRGLHALRPGEPFRDGQLVLGLRACKAGVVPEKLHDVAVPGMYLAGNGSDIAARQRTKPAPGPAECASAASDNRFDGQFAREKRPCQRVQERPIRHRSERRRAPTILSRREQICVLAQRRSRDEC